MSTIGRPLQDDDASESTRSATVRVKPRQHFEDEDFNSDHDKFKNAIILPETVLDRLFPDETVTGYVSVPAVGGGEIPLYAIPFDDEYAPTYEDGVPVAFLRPNVQQRIDFGSDERTLSLAPVELVDSGPLSVVRFSTHTESTRPGECRAHPTVLDRIGVADGDPVELYNPDTGGRILAFVRAEPEMEADAISLSTRARKLLRVEFEARAGDGDSKTLHARRPVEYDPDPRTDDGLLGRAKSLPRRAATRILDRAVDYHEVRLRVFIGLNADEGRSTARVNPDTMRVLGIDDGDRVVVTSQTDATTVRCHSIAPDSHLVEKDEDIGRDDVRDRTILLPATEREAVNALCDDVVRVRRDTSYIAAKSIVPSLFGFLGVFIGGLQSIDLLLPPALKPPAMAAVLLVSVSAIWFVLWPERQRCR